MPIRMLPPPPVLRFKCPRGHYIKSLTPLDPHIRHIRLPGMILADEISRDPATGEKVTREIELPRTLATSTDNDILTAGAKLGVPGLDPGNGRIKNAEIYATHIQKLGEAAALKAIEEAIVKAEAA